MPALPRPALGLLSAHALSVTGNAVVGVALPWLVLETTGNAALAGVVAAAAFAPLVVSALVGGAVVDRLGRKRTSVVADLSSAGSVAVVPLLDTTVGLSFGVLLVLVAAGAIFDGPGMAGREALTVDVARTTGVPLAKLTGYREGLEGVGGLVGPGLAGILIATGGSMTALWACVALFVVATGLIVVTVPAPVTEKAGAETGERYWTSVVSGLRYLWREPTLRAVGLVAAVIFTFITPLEAVVLPAHFNAIDDIGALGLVLSGFAVGGIVGSIAYGVLADRLPRRALLIASLLATSATTALFALLPATALFVAIAVLVGLVAGPIGPVTSVIVQERTPEHLRGRVIGTLTSLALAGAPAGLLLAGPLVELIGVASTLLVIAGGCALSGLVAARSAGLRRIEVGKPRSLRLAPNP